MFRKEHKNLQIVYVLFIFCRKREEEKKREVLTNPVKMKKIKEMVLTFVMDLFARPLKILIWLLTIFFLDFDYFTVINKPTHVWHLHVLPL